MGYTVLYLSLIVLIPLSTIFLEAKQLSWHRFFSVVENPEAVAAYKLSFGASFAAACVNIVFGLLVAWVLARYRFPGRRLFDALVDLPFALPTAVAGIALADVYGDDGWIGHLLARHNIHVAYTPLGVFVALVFVSLPYVVRTVQPIIQDLESDVEEAAASLGAGRLQVFYRIIIPTVAPALLTGFSLAFARALGEYGSVVFISNNIPFQGEIVPKLIIDHLSEFDYSGATALGVVMLVSSFIILLLINSLQSWASRHQRA